MEDLSQAMTEGRIGIKIALQNREGKEDLYFTLQQNFPIDEPVYDYHVGVAEAPRSMQEGLDPGPEEDEVQAEEKPYSELA